MTVTAFRVGDLPGTNCYCDDDAALAIERRMQASFLVPEGIRLLGSGNYHYLTWFFLKQIREPFGLVLIDHHPDMLPAMGGLLSCGSWVLEALLRLPALRFVAGIGVDETLVAEMWETLSQTLPETQYADLRSRVLFLSGTEALSVPGAAETGMKTVPAGLPVYLSIDKDVLSAEEVATNWDQGTMRLQTLCDLVSEICASYRVLGADICGAPGEQERSADPKAEERAAYADEQLCRLLLT